VISDEQAFWGRRSHWLGIAKRNRTPRSLDDIDIEQLTFDDDSRLNDLAIGVEHRTAGEQKRGRPAEPRRHRSLRAPRA